MSKSHNQINTNSLFVSEDVATCQLDLFNWKKAISTKDEDRDKAQKEKVLEKFEEELWYWVEFFQTNETMRIFLSSKIDKKRGKE